MWWKQTSSDSDVVVSTRVRFARNLKGYKFPNTMNLKQADEVIDKIDKAIDKSKYSLFKMSDIDKVNRYSLIEQHIISKEFADNIQTGAIITNKDNSIVTMINEEDHLRMQAFESGLNVEKCYDNLSEFSNQLAKKLEYAINSDYGYITACPTNVGSGMRVSVMLHLPALAKVGYLSQLLEEVSNMGLAVRGLYGENTTGYGNMYQISNQETLGEYDSEVVYRIKAVVLSIIEQERKARKILQKNSIKLEDEIYRTYGILKNARLLSEKEAIEYLSLLRLGVAMGVIDKIPLNKVQTLIIESASNTLKLLLKDNLEDEYDEDLKRAEYIRKEID